eukprot:4167087-Karenia_brevis.AAC.1
MRTMRLERNCHLNPPCVEVLQTKVMQTSRINGGHHENMMEAARKMHNQNVIVKTQMDGRG